MTKTYNWTTEKGAKVELEIAITPAIIDADWGVKASKGTMDVAKFTVNGKQYNAELMGNQITFWAGKQKAAANLPTEIAESIYAEEILINKLASAVSEQYHVEDNKIKKAMSE